MRILIKGPALLAFSRQFYYKQTRAIYSVVELQWEAQSKVGCDKARASTLSRPLTNSAAGSCTHLVMDPSSHPLRAEAHAMATDATMLAEHETDTDRISQARLARL